MNDKEKLISLLILTDPNPYTCESESGSCELTTCTECRARSTADLLIENGVTVQECGQWIYDFNLAGSNFYRCSVCDRQETLLEKEDIYEYCPFCHCGAKMMPHPPKGE